MTLAKFRRLIGAQFDRFSNDSMSLFNPKPQLVAHHDVAESQPPTTAKPLAIDGQLQP
jgi:hypothetical protein